jgi:outer membrane protein assembly factor BamB
VGGRRAATGLVMLAVALAPVRAGAVDGPVPARYVDGTITTWDSRSGDTRWTAKPDDGRYLQVGALGRSVVVALSGDCDGDGLVRTRLVGLDARTGKVRWRGARKGSIVTPDTGSGIVVTVPGFKRLAGLSAQTGKRKWKLDGSLMGSNETTIFVQGDAPSSTVQAHHRASGQLRWSLELPPVAGPGFDIKLVASNERQTVLASGGFNGSFGGPEGGSTPFGPTTLVTVESDTGRELHRTVVADPELGFSTGVLHDDVLALINGQEVNGINLASGQIVWRYPMPPASTNYRGVLSSGLRGKVAIYSSNGTRETIALDTTTGTPIWSRPLGMVGSGPAASTVVLAPLRTYTEEPLEGVDIATGTTLWTRTLRSDYSVPEPSLVQPRFFSMAVRCGTA